MCIIFGKIHDSALITFGDRRQEEKLNCLDCKVSCSQMMLINRNSFTGTMKKVRKQTIRQFHKTKSVPMLLYGSEILAVTK